MVEMMDLSVAGMVEMMVEVLVDMMVDDSAQTSVVLMVVVSDDMTEKRWAYKSALELVA